MGILITKRDICKILSPIGKGGCWARIYRHTHASTHACTHACTQAHTHNHFTALWILFRATQVSRYQNKHSPRRSISLTPIVDISHPLSASSIYYNPWHPLWPEQVKSKWQNISHKQHSTNWQPAKDFGEIPMASPNREVKCRCIS